MIIDTQMAIHLSVRALSKIFYTSDAYCKIMSRYNKSSNKAWRRPGGNESTNIQWNLGDPIPAGAALPLDKETGDPIWSLATYGSGTLEDPCVSCLSRYILCVTN